MGVSRNEVKLVIVWDFRSDVENYVNLTLVNKNEWDRFLECSFDGRKHSENWSPFAVKAIEVKNDSDFPSLSPGVPVLTDQAITILEQYLQGNTEILNLKSRVGNYSIINVTNVIDCIDYDKSDFKRFKSSGEIMKFFKYCFIADKIAGAHIFKITDLPHGYVFVSDDFKTKVEQSGLVGYEFIKVWEQ
jgi:hypothetical protein